MSVREKMMIGVDSLKELSYIDSNTDTKTCTVAIVRTQDNYIEPILGTPLFKKLLEDINNEDVTGIYQTLLDDYVIKYLVPMVEVALAPHINWQIRNKAVGSSSDEDITAGTEQSVYSLTATIRKEAQVYKRRLVGYLCDNSENIPEYNEATSDAEEISPDKDAGSTLNMGFIGG